MMKNAKILEAVERSVLKTRKEEKGKRHKINYTEAGITLVALVVTMM